MEEALREEIKATLNFNHDEWAKKKEQDATTCGAKPLTFVEWEKLSNDDPRKRVKIIISADMGWQARIFFLYQCMH
eukprot:5705978-Ditylum_brightwellii.AAC.1